MGNWNVVELIAFSQLCPHLDDRRYQTRIVGVDFSDQDISNANLSAFTFVDCDFTDAIMRNVCLNFATFEGCEFVNTDLSDADCRHVSWDERTLKRLRYWGANLTNACVSDYDVENYPTLQYFWRERGGEVETD